MSLIKQPNLTPFKSEKGFKYPQFWDFYKAHDRIHWVSEEISLSKDIQDFQNASPEEQEYIKGVLRLFTQNEVKH